MKSNVKNSFLILLFSLLFTQLGFAQFEIPEIPKKQTSVYDYANILSPEEKAQLEEKLVRYSDSTTTQIVVITIESLKGEDVSLLATNWGQKWLIAYADKAALLKIRIFLTGQRLSCFIPINNLRRNFPQNKFHRCLRLALIPLHKSIHNLPVVSLWGYFQL